MAKAVLARGRLTILGTKWSYRVLSEAAYRRHLARQGLPENAVALTHTAPARQLVFCASKVCVETVRHELAHAFIDSVPFFTQGLGKKRESFEEMVCDLIGAHAPDIVRQGNVIMRAIRKAGSK